MNKKGQSVIVWMMIAIVIFIASINLIPPLQDQIVTTKNETNLNCSSSDISTNTQVTCNVVEFGLFYFISICIAISLAVIAQKRTITGVMTAIFLFMVIILMITPLKDLIIQARDVDHLACGTAAITAGANMLCIFVDLWLFYFICLVIASGITYIFLKKVGE